MGTGGIIATSAAAVSAAAVIWFYVRRKLTPKKIDSSTGNDNMTQKVIDCVNNNIEVETISHELNFLEIVSWFKSLTLVKDKEIPFVANPLMMKDLLQINPISETSIIIGVYNLDKDVITHAKLINATSLDAKTKEILANEPLVVLN